MYCLCVFILYYYVRTSVLLKFMLLILKLCFVFVGDEKLYLKISQILVVCICCCYDFHIFLSFASESRVARNIILIQGYVL